MVGSHASITFESVNQVESFPRLPGTGLRRSETVVESHSEFKSAESGRFFLPGPTEVHPDVLAAQLRPMIGHRGAEIESLMARLQEGLRLLFRTERAVFVSTSSATGLMEAGVRNGVRGGLLALVNGAFSERFARIAEASAIPVERLETPGDRPHDPADVVERLRSGRFDTVSVVHSETSTGMLNPVRELAEAVREFDDVLLLVDSVSGLGGAPLLTDEWGLDFALTGSQKALALPPGLAFGVASERMAARAAAAPGKGLYFDLTQHARKLERLQTPSTPALSLMYALEVQLDRIRREGLEARWDRHRRMAERTWAWVDGLREERGLELSVFAPVGYRSPTVTCVALPETHSGTDVRDRMRARGYVLATGYGAMKEGAIRIGHMGEHDLAALERLLGTLEEVLVE